MLILFHLYKKQGEQNRDTRGFLELHKLGLNESPLFDAPEVSTVFILIPLSRRGVERRWLLGVRVTSIDLADKETALVRAASEVLDWLSRVA